MDVGDREIPAVAFPEAPPGPKSAACCTGTAAGCSFGSAVGVAGTTLGSFEGRVGVKVEVGVTDC